MKKTLKKKKLSYTISHIAEVLSAETFLNDPETVIEHLLTDSRKMLFPESSLFFAISGRNRSGNVFIKGLYEKGVRNFLTDNKLSKDELKGYADANFLISQDPLHALQTLAAYHRHQFTYPVIGITGSNGKTIVKEWMYQLAGEDFNIVRSPKSYNSQVGVPLSIWRMHESNTLGIFESGISKAGEMQNLQRIIDPEIGVVTFIGTAHDEGFANKREKINEKLQLFKNSQILVFDADDEVLAQEIKRFSAAENISLHSFTRSKRTDADLFVKDIRSHDDQTDITCIYHQNEFSFTIPFTDIASVNNSLTCCSILLVLGIPANGIAHRMLHLRPVAMRLELRQGLNNCSVINDSYSADLNSLSIALDFLEQQQQHPKKTVVLSDLLQSGDEAYTLYRKIASVLKSRNIDRFIGVGPAISAQSELFEDLPEKLFYPNTDALADDLTRLHFNNETILLKGARVFRFEKISNQLEYKVHETLLEINLNALRHNLIAYREKLNTGVKLMAMVKAFSYGSGSYEIANLMQHAGVEYLAVAYADEGAELRRHGIRLPIMVMNTEASAYATVIKYNLEPEVFSFSMLRSFKEYLHGKKIKGYPVHIKIDTGMHRLGFEEGDSDALIAALKDENTFRVVSVFSHLAGSDAADHDGFTDIQAEIFTRIADAIQKCFDHKIIRHISNSSAIFRHPDLQMDMVRLGIGLYGVDASPAMQHQLKHVTTLKTTISQIKNVKKGETVGYSRKGVVQQDSRIATVRIGYADGYPRILSNGKGKMLINGNAVPVIGNVCMDMTMLDVTGADAEEGDEVIVFGEEPSVTDVAQWADTISYEILTNISQRVKRIYYEE